MLRSDQTDHPIQPVNRFRADPEETLPLIELDKRFLAVDADDTASEHLETGTYQVYGHLDEFMTYVFVHTVVLGELTDEVCIGQLSWRSILLRIVLDNGESSQTVRWVIAREMYATMVSCSSSEPTMRYVLALSLFS